MSQQRQKAARRPYESFPWIGTRLLRFFFLFYGSGVVVLGVCAAKAGFGAAAAHVRAYQRARQRARDRVWTDAGEYGSRFWTDACVLEHLRGRNSKPSHHVSAVPTRDICTLSYVGYALKEPQAMASASATLEDFLSNGTVLCSPFGDCVIVPSHGANGGLEGSCAVTFVGERAEAHRIEERDAVDHACISNLSHYNASAGPIRGSVLNNVCNLSDARSLVGSHVEESQAMVWVSATVNASMPWLKFGSLAAACAGPRRAVVPLLLSTSVNGVSAADDERWVTTVRRRLDGIVSRLERDGGPHPGVEVVGKCLRWWESSAEESSGEDYYFMKITHYDETSKMHDCTYIDCYEDGGRCSEESERIDLSKNPDIIPCMEEYVGLTMKLYEGMCSEEYRVGKILLYDEPTDKVVLRFPDGTQEGHVLELGNIKFCDVARDMEVCPYGADDPCEGACENDCEMEDEGYKPGDYVEVESVDDPETHYPAIVQRVTSNGLLSVRYQGVGPNGKERGRESGIPPARVRWQTEGSEVGQTCSVDGSENGDGVCTVYKSGDRVEVLKNGRYYAAIVARVRLDGRLGVNYKGKVPGGKSCESGVDLARVRWPSDGEDDAEDDAYKPYDRVEVLQEVDGEVQEVDGDWLPGKLRHQRVTGEWSVTYDNGDTENGVPESRIRRPEVEDEDPVDPHLDTCWLKNMDQYDAMKTYLERIEMPGGKNAYKHLMETVDSALTVTFENHVLISHETDCFTDMRSAAPTFMMQKRCTQWALNRCDTMKKDRFKPQNMKASDKVALQLCPLYESLGVTDREGRVKGPYRDVAHATDRVRSRRAGWHLGTPLTCLMYKGTQMAVRSGHLSPWIPERFSCTFAKYSGTRTLALNWAEGFFGDEELCDACQYPRDAKARNWDLLHKKKPLPKKSVMYVGVSGPHYIKHALERNAAGQDPPMFIGDVFDATDYDASDWSLKDIAPEGSRADADYWEKFVARHRVDAKLYEALDDAGQIPPLNTDRRVKKPVYEWNQLKVALDVGNNLYRGFTDVAKGVEIAFVVDKFFYGNEHTFEYMKLWDPSWKITQDFLRLADVASFDELTLAPLPTKTGYVIAEGVGGVSGLRWLPEGQIASSPGGGQRVKRKRDEKDGREMRCYRVGCGESFIYCPNDGVWKDDAVHESTISPGVQCPKCEGRGCKFV